MVLRAELEAAFISSHQPQVAAQPANTSRDGGPTEQTESARRERKDRDEFSGCYFGDICCAPETLSRILAIRHAARSSHDEIGGTGSRTMHGAGHGAVTL
jgi:hypothetical protein